MTTALVLLTRDLRVHDNPALAAAAEHERVIPLFVLDEGLLASDFNRPNRARFLAESLADLRERLRRRGGDLVIRRGDPVRQVTRLAGEHDVAAVHLSRDVSGFAQRRQRRLADELGAERVHLHEGVTVVAPGAVTPHDGDHYAVFTPYSRAWLAARWREPVDPPRRLTLPDGLDAGELPQPRDICGGELGRPRDVCGGGPSPHLPKGGETEGRKRVGWWLDDGVAGYGDGHDDLAGDRTSRLSPYLHFGAVSPLEIAVRADRRRAGVDPFVRQLAWRDFHHQVLAARPQAATEDYRGHDDDWRRDDDAFEAWCRGETGIPIVDAGMRQLHDEGWMHNRARLVTASFLTKTLYVDWRRGARHFFDWLVDGDLANNTMNWQWVAGTGTDTRPNRVLNPLRQAERFDPDGAYVRRHVPELADVPGKDVHAPWELERPPKGYPQPIVDIKEAARRFRAARAG